MEVRIVGSFGWKERNVIGVSYMEGLLGRLAKFWVFVLDDGYKGMCLIIIHSAIKKSI